MSAKPSREVVLEFNGIGFQILREKVLADPVRHIGPVGYDVGRTGGSAIKIGSVAIRIKGADGGAETGPTRSKKSAENAIPQRGDAPIVKSELISDAQFLGHGIHAGPISVDCVPFRPGRPRGRPARRGCPLSPSNYGLVEIRYFIIRRAIGDRSRGFELAEIVGLEPKDLRRHEIPRPAYLAVGDKAIAIWIDGGRSRRPVFDWRSRRGGADRAR